MNQEELNKFDDSNNNIYNNSNNMFGMNVDTQNLNNNVSNQVNNNFQESNNNVFSQNINYQDSMNDFTNVSNPNNFNEITPNNYQQTDINYNNVGMNQVVTPDMNDNYSMNSQSQINTDESVPNMMANPNAEISPINFNQVDEPYIEETYTEKITEEDLELEKRNRSGLRFMVIFGVIILIFVILLPYLYELF